MRRELAVAVATAIAAKVGEKGSFHFFYVVSYFVPAHKNMNLTSNSCQKLLPTFVILSGGSFSSSAKAADCPPSRRRQGVRLRIEQEAAERLALGLGGDGWLKTFGEAK